MEEFNEATVNILWMPSCLDAETDICRVLVASGLPTLSFVPHPALFAAHYPWWLIVTPISGELRNRDCREFEDQIYTPEAFDGASVRWTCV